MTLSLLRGTLPCFSSPVLWRKPNAGRHAPPIAAAQRRLLAVACTPLFGWGAPVGLWIGCPPSTPRTSHSSRLLDHLVRLEEERRGDREAERLGGLEIDDELELHRPFHRQVGGLRAFE